MINCIGFIPKGINIKHLKSFEKQENILNKLTHLELPIVDQDEESNDSSEEDFIVETDQLVYSTPNNTELSYLQFNIYDNELDDFVVHHDIYVFSSINDTEYLNLNNNHYVALATFENNIMVYDSLVKNPMHPQILLEGHQGPVMAVTKDSTSLYSGSEDCSIIEWDLEKLCIKNRSTVDRVIEKLCVSNGSIVYGCKKSIFNFNLSEEIQLEGNIENMVVIDNDVYVGDSSGILSLFDLRNFKEIKRREKLSKYSLTGLDVLKDSVSVCSLGGELVVLDSLTLKTKYSNKLKNEIYSIKLSEDNILFYGDDSDNLNYKKIENF